jgi:hypothetical protein
MGVSDSLVRLGFRGVRVCLGKSQCSEERNGICGGVIYLWIPMVTELDGTLSD